MWMSVLCACQSAVERGNGIIDLSYVSGKPRVTMAEQKVIHFLGHLPRVLQMAAMLKLLPRALVLRTEEIISLFLCCEHAIYLLGLGCNEDHRDLV